MFCSFTESTDTKSKLIKIVTKRAHVNVRGQAREDLQCQSPKYTFTDNSVMSHFACLRTSALVKCQEISSHSQTSTTSLKWETESPQKGPGPVKRHVDSALASWSSYFISEIPCWPLNQRPDVPGPRKLTNNYTTNWTQRCKHLQGTSTDYMMCFWLFLTLPSEFERELSKHRLTIPHNYMSI